MILFMRYTYYITNPITIELKKEKLCRQVIVYIGKRNVFIFTNLVNISFESFESRKYCEVIFKIGKLTHKEILYQVRIENK